MAKRLVAAIMGILFIVQTYTGFSMTWATPDTIATIIGLVTPVLLRAIPNRTTIIRDWTEAAGIENGFTLRTVFGERIGEEAIAPYSVSRRLKRLVEKAGLDAETVSNLSGHSMRVGAAQDMAEEGFDLLALI